MDYGILPPEINSSRIYAGPGSGPMLVPHQRGMARRRAGFRGVWSYRGDRRADRRSLAGPGVSVNGGGGHTLSRVAEHRGCARRADCRTGPCGSGSLRCRLRDDGSASRGRGQPYAAAALVATNVMGQNTAAIAATEALYGEMWAQDAAAMYGYAGSSAAAATVTPFSSPPETTNAAGAASQGGAVSQAAGTSSSAGVQSALSQVVSTVPPALQSLADASAEPQNAASVPLAFGARRYNELSVKPCQQLVHSDVGGRYNPGRRGSRSSAP